MLQLGNYADDYATLNFCFTTVPDATLIPTVLAGAPVIAVYKGSATGTEKTSAEAYITLDIDFDSVVGLNHVLIDLSADAFFVAGQDYYVVITTGTVGGTSRVGMVIAHFAIAARFMRGTDSAALASVLGAAVDGDISTDIANVQTVGDAIEVATITNATGADVATDVVALKAETVLILADTDDIGVAGAGLTDLGGMSAGMKAEVNVEAKDVLFTDTVTQPGQATPAANSSISTILGYLFKNWRNKKIVTASAFQLLNDDAATVDQKATVADSGTAGSITEIETGP